MKKKITAYALVHTCAHTYAHTHTHGIVVIILLFGSFVFLRQASLFYIWESGGGFTVSLCKSAWSHRLPMPLPAFASSVLGLRCVPPGPAVVIAEVWGI